MFKRKYQRWIHLILVTAVSLGVGVGQGIAAPKKPIPSKSARNAAISQAATTILASPVTLSAPASPTDETKVPHYFGPFPNWANSPFTLADATVTIDPPASGTTATATATVGAGGAVTGITITDPGSGYLAAPVVTITDSAGTNTSATATATITASGSVTAVNVDAFGTGYTAPVVTLTGGCTPTPGCEATAHAQGGVDDTPGVIEVTAGGSGYTNPTVDFDYPAGVDGVQARAHAITADDGTGNGTFTITGIVVDQTGSGYLTPPNVVIRDGTIYEPIIDGGTGATATAKLQIQQIVLDTFGSGYTSVPTVTITDPTGTDATATAVTNFGAVTDITLTAPGSGYLTTGGIKKFMDTLPMLCNPTDGSCATATNNLGQHLSIGVPDTTTFTIANGFANDADYYIVALVQHREQMNSSLPAKGTLLREYVQLAPIGTDCVAPYVLLNNDLPDGTSVPAMMPDGVTQACGLDQPHFLGPVIVAQKDRPVRVTFFNLLPTGSGGDLYIPTDSTMMGAGYGPLDNGWPPITDLGTVTDDVRNPECTVSVLNPDGTELLKGDNTNCMKDSRATLHLHGGTTPWISDGTPHQWITPKEADPAANPWPEGESVGVVPDMAGGYTAPDGTIVPDCSGLHDGCQSFYWTNQQSARLMFYHDHAFGTTRLNVYLGEAAGYVIQDPTEQALVAAGTIPADVIPLIIQDRTFVPSDHSTDPANPTQLDLQDPTWDATHWGNYGDFWYHHVYMPAQNPGDPSGMSAFGRWMYGPWFWPPADPPHGPIANPYYTGSCDLNDPATWQYQTDPFCEPPLIPGTPNISAGMEQFNDTPLVNGTAYPTITVEPKAYRLRVLNAANDRFFNLQLYLADATTASTDFNGLGQPIGGTEVAFNPAELAAAQIDPNIFPTPVDSTPLGGPESTAGPNWIVIANEGGFLPAPVEVDGQQPTTWIIDPTVFNVGNVDKHSLLVAPAERTDAIVDFSPYAGQTLILYNDAPAAFPARVASYDYYTGAPDLSPVGAPTILPGYGPNTRTVMQIKVASTTPAPAFDLVALEDAFRHKADGSGVFESGQHPIIVGQAEYNSAYGTDFVASGDCKRDGTTQCDGHLRIPDQGGTDLVFNTLLTGITDTLSIPIEPKAIHDEMNAAAFDEFGRMTANIGLEVVPATPALQNIVLYPYINPQTEIFDATNLPKNQIGVEMTPIAFADGAQIWRITHNGVDTHPLHFHLYDVQLLNRVTWDNIVELPDPTELGWKDTVRTSPLEDTIVAMRPLIPDLPFDLPNSIRPLNPAMPLGATMGFNNIDANGNPTDPIINSLVNFGWEYVWHCHILSHEEMDMMRPQSVVMQPNAPSNLTWVASGNGGNTALTLTWNDNSINETQFLVQKNDGTGWVDLAIIPSPLDQVNTMGTVSYTDTTFRWDTNVYVYRIIAQNTAGYGGQFMSVTTESVSQPVAVIQPPTDLTATLQAGPQVTLNWTDNAKNETGYVIERSDNGGAFVQIGTAPASNNTGTYVDNTVVIGDVYDYRVAAVVDGVGSSAYSNTVTVLVDVPAAPSSVNATAVRVNNVRESITLTWTDNAINESGFEIQRATDANFTANLVTSTVGADVTTYNTGNIQRGQYYIRVHAVNVLGSSVWVNATPFPLPPPL